MPPEDKVREQLERILSSHALAGSDQLKRLLRLVVERTLNGRSELLKEYNLGVEVFQRPPEYDPKLDPIVRVQARRLRAKLDEYYAGEGAQDSLIIEIPKGAYVPVFTTREPSAAVTVKRTLNRWHLLAIGGATALIAFIVVASLSKDKATIAADLNRSIAVLPLKAFTANGGRSHIADQATEVLTTELAKNKQLRVLSRTTASRYRETESTLPEIATALSVRWVVEGGVGVQGSRAYVKLRAVDSFTDRKIWADGFDCEVSELAPMTTRAANNISAAILNELRASPPKQQ